METGEGVRVAVGVGGGETSSSGNTMISVCSGYLAKYAGERISTFENRIVVVVLVVLGISVGLSSFVSVTLGHGAQVKVEA